MLLIERLKNEHFSDSQKAVVDFMVQQKLEIRNMTVREIAKKTFTSSATLIRIAHRMGYSGWEELKNAFVDEQEYLQSHFNHVDANFPFSKTDSDTSITHKLAILEKEAIDDTLALLDYQELEQVIDVLESSSLINITAMNNTVSQAQEFVTKMGRIGKHVCFQSTSGEARYNGLIHKKNSCLIVISYTGETQLFMQFIKEAKAYRIPVIAITSLGDNTISKMSDYVLRICTREKQYSKISWFTLDVSISYMLNVLYALYFARHYEENLRYKVSQAKRIEVNRRASSAIIIEDLKDPFEQDLQSDQKKNDPAA